jgi:hypothetical protein
MPETMPITSGGMNALRLPAFFKNLGHSNKILTAGGGAFGHKDGPKQGATSCRQGEEAWKLWKASTCGNVSLSDGVIEFAKTHEDIKGAFLTFQKDANQELRATTRAPWASSAAGWARVHAKTARQANAQSQQARPQSSDARPAPQEGSPPRRAERRRLHRVHHGQVQQRVGREPMRRLPGRGTIFKFQ